MEYASPSWNPYTSRNINKIEAVQRRAARFVLGNYNYINTSGLIHDIHHRLKWIPLQHRRALYDLALFYKIRSNMININFPPIVQPSSRQPNRYLHVQAPHSDAYKYNANMEHYTKSNIIISKHYSFQDSNTQLDNSSLLE